MQKEKEGLDIPEKAKNYLDLEESSRECLEVELLKINKLLKNNIFMDDKIIQYKIERSLEIICPLYRENLITDAYIIDSVAKGTAKGESDIDMLMINPLFEAYLEELSPDIELENIKKLVDKLKNMGYSLN